MKDYLVFVVVGILADAYHSPFVTNEGGINKVPPI